MALLQNLENNSVMLDFFKQSSSQVTADQGPKQGQLPMKEVLNPGYDRDWQGLRASPIEHAGQGHSVVDFTMHDQGFIVQIRRH
jgi:hypothetical protein